MYSIKPGRGPSLGSAIGGAIAVVFGIFWTVSTASMGAPGFFVFFGIIFVLVGIGSTVYSLYNATAPNRFSEYDITSHREESDPLSDALGHWHEQQAPQNPSDPARTADDAGALRRYPGNFCPFCGASVQDVFDYCPKCGKDI